MSSLTELRAQLDEKRRHMHAVTTQAGPDYDMDRVTILEGDSYSKGVQLRTMNEELNELGAEVSRLEGLQALSQANSKLLNGGKPGALPGFIGGEGGDEPEMKTRLAPGELKRMWLGSQGYKEFRGGTRSQTSLEIPVSEFKTLITLTTVNAQADRLGLTNMALEERTLMDMMPSSNVGGNTVEYYEETTFTNAAAEVAEGVGKSESALAYTLVTEAIRKIAHWIPATKEALDDVDFLEGQIRNRLAFGVRRREEQQILTGDGIAPNISGILDRSNLQTQAKGADPTPDAIYKAAQKVRGAAGAGFADPTLVVLHPNDWTDIRLLRTTDGIYIWGNPADPGPDRIWGLPVRQTTAMTENTGLVGDFRFAEILRRQGVVVTVSTEHASYFTENKVALLAESRLGLAVYRPSAFATVTGI